jgi:nucleotide-binding universal stress UspA family protein
MTSANSIGPIVVPLDGSKNAENALPQAALLSRLYGAKVEFVHVVDHEGVGGSKDVSRAGEVFAAHTAEIAAHWGIANHEARILEGHAAAMILEAAAHASFVVIASHGHGGFRAMFIGSVADKVVRGATVPVLLVPGVGGPVALDQRKVVLIGVDGSEAAEKGLRLGREIATKLGAPIALIRTWTIPTQATASAFVYSYYPTQEMIDSLGAAADEYIAQTVLPGEKSLVVQGPAPAMIAAAATHLDAELVVVASSGKGLAARFALGSTTAQLMHSLHRPLLIVPAGA